jgi:hypothetical protein
MAVAPRFKRRAVENRRNGMRPMAVLIGIIMGSAVAMSVSLSMSAIVFFLLPEYAVRLAPERLPLLKGLLWSWSLAAVGGATELALAAMLVALGFIYWP